MSGDHDYGHDDEPLQYVGTPSPHLLCAICQQPFVRPVCTPCGHTFCDGCILEALEFSPTCPEDRQPLGRDDLGPASRIIVSMVDELRVRCPEEGCGEEMQRQEVRGHIQEECLYHKVTCPNLGCEERVPRGALTEHVQACAFRVERCPQCETPLPPGEEGITHVTECRLGEKSPVEGEGEGEEGQQAERLLRCSGSGIGCVERITLLKAEHAVRIEHLDVENARLASRVSELEEEVTSLQQDQEQRRLRLEHDLDPLEGYIGRERRMREEVGLVTDRLSVLEVRMGMREAASSASEVSAMQEEVRRVREMCHRVQVQVGLLMANQQQQVVLSDPRSAPRRNPKL